MRTIAFINQKGGVGKTTSAVNIAAGLARDGRRVLLVDLDPQAHATQHVGVELAPGQRSIYDVLLGDAPLAGILRPVCENLTLAPSHIDLVAAEIELYGRPGRERILCAALQPHREQFDLALIDCGPSLGLLTLNALAAADEVVIPLQAHFLALQGLGRLLETVARVRESINPSLRVGGVLLCMYEPGTRLAHEVADDIRRFLEAAQPGAPWYGAGIFATPVRRNIKLAECPSFGKSIFDYAPRSRGVADYTAVAREIAPLPTPAPLAEACADEAAVMPGNGAGHDPAAAPIPADAAAPSESGVKLAGWPGGVDCSSTAAGRHGQAHAAGRHGHAQLSRDPLARTPSVEPGPSPCEAGDQPPGDPESMGLPAAPDSAASAS